MHQEKGLLLIIGDLFNYLEYEQPFLHTFLYEKGISRLPSLVRLWGEISPSKNVGSIDFAGIYITANRAIKITLQASTEQNYNYGYMSVSCPVCTSTSLAEVYVSGTESVSKTIYAGDSRYIGFFKDPMTSENDDKVTIIIEEV